MYRFLKALAKIILMPYFRVKVYGEYNINGAAIICSNHRSLLDPIIISCVTDCRIYYMAKSELFTDYGKPLGWLLSSLGAFPVERDKADRAALSRAAELLKGGNIVGIFPQGKIVKDEKSFKIKSGAALLAVTAGVPIVPVSIYCEGRVRPFKRITVRIGEPIHVKQERGSCSKKCRELSTELSKTVELLLGVEHGGSFGEVGGVLLRGEQSRYDSK